MIPKTAWIGGCHPCELSGHTSRAPATVLKDKLLEALHDNPGATSKRLMLDVFPEAQIKTINSALSRQEHMGRVYSRRCLEAFDDTGARRWVYRWFLTGRNWN